MSPPIPQLQPPSMVLLLLNPPLPKSSEFSVMPMISTTTLQLPTNGLSFIVLVHAFLAEIMILIIARNTMTKTALRRTRLSFERRGINDQEVVTVMEDVVVVAAINNAMETMKGTNL